MMCLVLSRPLALKILPGVRLDWCRRTEKPQAQKAGLSYRATPVALALAGGANGLARRLFRGARLRRRLLRGQSRAPRKSRRASPFAPPAKASGANGLARRLFRGARLRRRLLRGLAGLAGNSGGE